ncbi:MAG: cyclic nucleotide-binding domain-containing protein [Microscillaceae bacterium]|nr:cyclic nucleotide-binding domain-containing protein [Microscillaceae bacterium]
MNKYFDTLSQLSAGKIHLSSNEILYKEGSRADNLFGIQHGSLIVYKNDKQNKFLFPRFIKSGQILPLNTLQSGVYRDTAQTLTPVEAFLLNGYDVKHLLNKDIQLRIGIMQEMCKEISKIENLDLNHYNKSLKQKTAYILLEMARACGDDGIPDHCYKLIPLLLEASHKNWMKILDDLAHEGLIQRHGHKILVNNPEKMKKIV